MIRTERTRADMPSHWGRFAYKLLMHMAVARAMHSMPAGIDAAEAQQAALSLSTTLRVMHWKAALQVTVLNTLPAWLHHAPPPVHCAPSYQANCGRASTHRCYAGQQAATVHGTGNEVHA